MSDKKLVISKMTDKESLEKLSALRLIVPDALAESAKGKNPLMEHIIKSDHINKQLFDYLCRSDYLQELDKESLQWSVQLFENDADIAWYEMLQMVMEEPDDYGLFGKPIMDCFVGGISADACKALMDVSIDAAEMNEKVNKLIKKHEINALVESGDMDEEKEQLRKTLINKEQAIESLTKKNAELSGRLATYFTELDKAGRSIRELKAELIKERYEHAKLKEKETSKTHLGEKIKESLEKIKELEADNAKLSKELEDAFNTINAHTSELEKKDAMLKSLRSEADQNARFAEQYREELEKLALKQVEMEERIKSGIPEQVQGADDAFVKAVDEYDAVKGNEANDPTYEPYEIPDDEIEEEEDAKEEEAIEWPFFTDVKKTSETVLPDEEAKAVLNPILDFIYQHSRRIFNKKNQIEQESLVQIKMMKMNLTKEKTQFVKRNMGENTPYFDLYQLLSKNPTMEELESFFAQYKVEEEQQ